MSQSSAMLLGAVHTTRLGARAGNELAEPRVSLCRVAQDKGGVDGRSHRPPDVADGDDTSKPLFFRVPSSAESASATPGCERDNESLLMILPHEPR
eukprot:7379956-Prymnesium_polylepis.1